MKQKETPALAAFAGEFSTLNYRLQCASDMAFCLSVAFAGNDVDGAQAGNALWALSDYLSDQYDKQEALLDTFHDLKPESDEQTLAPAEQKRAYIEAARRQAYEAGRNSGRFTLAEAENT